MAELKISQTNRPYCNLRRRLLIVGPVLAMLACRKEDRGNTSSNYSPSRASQEMQHPDLLVTGGLIPGLADSAVLAGFIELIDALNDGYPQGKIEFRHVLSSNAYIDVAEGRADVAFPAMRLDATTEQSLPYRFASESIGRVSMVLYSHKDRPLTRERVVEAAARGQAYQIESVPSGLGLPLQAITDFESAFEKIAHGKIDGLIWAQEEADLALRKLGATQFHREHFDDFDDTFVVAKSPRGDFVDAILSEAIRHLRASGRLSKLHQKIHRPYQDWQP